MKEAPLIEIKGLNVGYEDRIVLHNVDLNVYERDFLAFMSVISWASLALTEAERQPLCVASWAC